MGWIVVSSTLLMLLMKMTEPRRPEYDNLNNLLSSALKSS